MNAKVTRKQKCCCFSIDLGVMIIGVIDIVAFGWSCVLALAYIVYFSVVQEKALHTYIINQTSVVIWIINSALSYVTFPLLLLVRIPRVIIVLMFVSKPNSSSRRELFYRSRVITLAVTFMLQSGNMFFIMMFEPAFLHVLKNVDEKYGSYKTITIVVAYILILLSTIIDGYFCYVLKKFTWIQKPVPRYEQLELSQLALNNNSFQESPFDYHEQDFESHLEKNPQTEDFYKDSNRYSSSYFQNTAGKFKETIEGDDGDLSLQLKDMNEIRLKFKSNDPIIYEESKEDVEVTPMN